MIFVPSCAVVVIVLIRSALKFNVGEIKARFDVAAVAAAEALMFDPNVLKAPRALSPITFWAPPPQDRPTPIKISKTKNRK